MLRLDLLLDDDDSAELDAIISELRDFKIHFEECSNLPSPTSSSSSSSHSTASTAKLTKMELSPVPLLSSNTSNGCVYELRTLEDQLEAALASLTLTINDCSTSSTHLDCQQQQRSSGSSACSSGLGDEIGNDSLNLYQSSTSQHPTGIVSSGSSSNSTSKTIVPSLTLMTDDCDSAFSDSGSTDKMTSVNQDESVRLIGTRWFHFVFHRL